MLNLTGTLQFLDIIINDPERYGVAEFDGEGNAISDKEKPSNPLSNYAVVGLYFYPKILL